MREGWGGNLSETGVPTRGEVVQEMEVRHNKSKSVLGGGVWGASLYLRPDVPDERDSPSEMSSRW